MPENAEGLQQGEFLWPHQHSRPIEPISLVPPARRNEYLGLVRKSFTNLNHNSPKTLEVNQKIMQMINGEGSEVLVNKFSFIEQVRELGYGAPTQTLVHLENHRQNYPHQSIMLHQNLMK